MEVEDLGETEREILNLLAHLTFSIGLGEAVGRVLGTLILLKTPLSQSEISTLTGYSPGVVSMSLSKLERLGIVRVAKKVGKKKLYIVTSNLLDMIEVFLCETLDKQLMILSKYIQDHVSSLSDKTKNNVMALLDEARKSRYAVQLAVMLFRKLNTLSPKEVFRAFNSIKGRLSNF